MKKLSIIVFVAFASVIFAQKIQVGIDCEVINSMDSYFLRFIREAKQNNFGDPKLKLSAELLRVRKQQILSRKNDYPLKTMFCDSVSNDTLKWLFKNGYCTSFGIPVVGSDNKFIDQYARYTRFGESVCTYHIYLVPFDRKGDTISLFFMVFQELKLCGTVAKVSGQGKELKLSVGEKLKVDEIEMFSNKNTWSVKPVVDGHEIKYGSDDEIFKDVDISFILLLESIE